MEKQTFCLHAHGLESAQNFHEPFNKDIGLLLKEQHQIIFHLLL